LGLARRFEVTPSQRAFGASLGIEGLREELTASGAFLSLTAISIDPGSPSAAVRAGLLPIASGGGILIVSAPLSWLALAVRVAAGLSLSRTTVRISVLALTLALVGP
jgi:hypothetical protein